MTPNHILSLESQIDQIIKEFDWERVHKVMLFLEWKWSDSKTNNSVPSIPELKKSAVAGLRQVYSSTVRIKRGYQTSSGGLVYSCEYFPEYPPILTLSFVLTDWRFYHESQDIEDVDPDLLVQRLNTLE